MKIFIALVLLIELLLVGVFLATPVLVSAQEIVCPEDSPPGSVCLENPIKIAGVDSPGELVIAGFQGFSGIIGLVAIAFMVFSGFKLAVATNDESRNAAKQSILWSAGGFAVALLAFTTISGVASLIGFDPAKVDLPGDTLGSPLAGPADPFDFVSVMFFIMSNVLGLLGFATVLVLIYYGFRYLTSAGNEEAIESAKTGIKWSLIGFIVALLAFTIISIVRRSLLNI